MLKAKKHLGQNFLKNTHILENIVGDNSLSPVEVIEIGPGPGDLTNVLLSKKPKKLFLIEIDPDMINLLEKRFQPGSFTLYAGDALEANIVNEKNGAPHVNQKIQIPITSKNYVVYGNIPYYITSPLLFHFLYGVDFLPESITFTMQKEVAERILARDGKGSVLSLACHNISIVEKVCDISPNNFFPVPKVWSTCLRFHLKKDGGSIEGRKFLKFLEKGFAHKRKKLISNLSENTSQKEKILSIIAKLGLHEGVRAEELNLHEWQQLYTDFLT